MTNNTINEAAPAPEQIQTYPSNEEFEELLALAETADDLAYLEGLDPKSRKPEKSSDSEILPSPQANALGGTAVNAVIEQPSHEAPIDGKTTQIEWKVTDLDTYRPNGSRVLRSPRQKQFTASRSGLPVTSGRVKSAYPGYARK